MTDKNQFVLKCPFCQSVKFHGPKSPTMEHKLTCSECGYSQTLKRLTQMNRNTDDDPDIASAKQQSESIIDQLFDNIKNK